MKLWNLTSLLIVGGIAACAQVMWAHGDKNRLGEYAFELAILLAMLPLIACRASKRYQSWLATRSKAREIKQLAARHEAERAHVRQLHRHRAWRDGNMEAISE